MTGPAQGFRRLLQALDSLGIPCMVGGSVASSIHGMARSTHDVDLVADIHLHQVTPLAAQIKAGFYCDPEAMREGIRRGRMFNLIHYESSYKFDIFPLTPEPYQQAQFARRRPAEFSFEGETVPFYVASPEDTILTKLAWYRAGNQVAERQWSDVLDVILVKRELLDLQYLRQWAGPLHVADLLEAALAQGAA